MKIFLVKFIFLCFYSFLQDKVIPPDTTTRTIPLNGSFPATDLTKKEQFDRALTWFSTFRDVSFELIDTGDPALGVIQAKGFVERSGIGAASRNLYKTTFTLVVRLLGGVYRYQLHHLSIVPFKNGYYRPKQEKLLDTSGIINIDSLKVSKSRHNRTYYQEARRIAELIVSSIDHSLSKK